MIAMDEMLVEYLLNSLDADEQRDIEERVQHEPELRDRLAALRRTLAPLAVDAEAPEPSPRLVLDTLARVAEEHCRQPAPPPRLVLPSEAAPARRWFRRADLVAAAVVLLLVGALAGPWLVRQWQDYQIRACQRNLAVFWNGLQFHSELHHGAFPQLEAAGSRSFAGIVVPILNDNKLLGHDASILCPAIGKRKPDERSVSDLNSLWEQSSPEQYRAAIRDVGGSYAYPLGYWDGPRLVGLHRDSNDTQPIMADAPGASHVTSANHGGRGQNVLFVGGQVRWCTSCYVGPDGDDIFVNKNNEVAAGLYHDDVVLGAGDACVVSGRP
jgi:hypothetical protein